MDYKTSDGIALTFQKPEGKGKFAVIILCHGFCGIREILLPDFAEAFNKAGFSTITFDYLGFGDSDGERGRIEPEKQIKDILSVLDWARKQPEIDENRIALWGTSFGGCHVFGAAVNNPFVKCIVSQLAFADGEEIVTSNMTDSEKDNFITSLNSMHEKKKNTGKEIFVGVNRILNDPDSRHFFDENKINHPELNIKIPFLTVRNTLLYKPAINAEKVTCPTLVIAAGKDIVNPPEQGQALFNAVKADKKSFYIEENARHYDMYAGEYFARVSKLQIDWFRTHLLQ
ncbi:alpha/beta fold hydrolase [Kosakonia sp. H02]|nr:alpha/beta fold hydrolase [Kosakonia sp. H02]